MPEFVPAIYAGVLSLNLKARGKGAAWVAGINPAMTPAGRPPVG